MHISARSFNLGILEEEYGRRALKYHGEVHSAERHQLLARGNTCGTLPPSPPGRHIFDLCDPVVPGPITGLREELLSADHTACSLDKTLYFTSMTEPEFIRERCVSLIRSHSMHERKWSMTLVDAMHDGIQRKVSLRKDELPIVSFYADDSRWTLCTTHRFLGVNGSEWFEAPCESFGKSQWGNFKQVLERPVVVEGTLCHDDRSVIFLYESGYASMAPIYYFRFWSQKWPVWKQTYQLTYPSPAGSSQKT